MTWVKTLSEDEVSGSLRQVYDAELARLGFVMEATKALSSRPEVAAAFDALTAAVKQASGLSPQERRLISLLVAQRLRSSYCVLVYATEVERDLGGLDRVRAVLDDYRAAGLSAREVAVLDYALAASTGHPTEEHITRLRGVGLDDGAIIDVAVWANLRAARSRIYEALGVETDPFFLEQA
ncbi:MAG: peroxidase-related enzyme, partial [Armatimonadota bacterium]|nr:peroxidase-related enzyme [Armatimonadota bacterium]